MKRACGKGCTGLIWIVGLHFTPEGYRVMFREVMRVIREDLPRLSPENLPFVFPSWEQALEQYR